MTVVRCNVCKREIKDGEGHYHIGPVSFVELGGRTTDIVEALAADDLRERFVNVADIDVCVGCWEKVKAAIAALIAEPSVAEIMEHVHEGKLPS